MTDLPPILTPELAGKLLDCAPKTVEERLRMGDLPGEKFGDGWILPTEAFLIRVNEIAVEAMRRRRLERAPQPPKLVAFDGQQCDTDRPRPGRRRNAAPF